MRCLQNLLYNVSFCSNNVLRREPWDFKFLPYRDENQKWRENGERKSESERKRVRKRVKER